MPAEWQTCTCSLHHFSWWQNTGSYHYEAGSFCNQKGITPFIHTKVTLPLDQPKALRTNCPLPNWHQASSPKTHLSCSGDLVTLFCHKHIFKTHLSVLHKLWTMKAIKRKESATWTALTDPCHPNYRSPAPFFPHHPHAQENLRSAEERGAGI